MLTRLLSRRVGPPAGEQDGAGGVREQRRVRHPLAGLEQAEAVADVPRAGGPPAAVDRDAVEHPAVAAHVRRAAREPRRLPARAAPRHGARPRRVSTGRALPAPPARRPYDAHFITATLNIDIDQ